MSRRRCAPAFLALACCTALRAQEPQPDDAARLATALNTFAATLHGQLGETPACSPASIGIALLMVLPGARGETAAELERLLALPEDLRGERLHAAAGRLLDAVTAPGRGKDPTVLRLVDELWVQRGYAIVPDYRTTLTDGFRTEPHAVDFAGAPAAARAAINAAVAKATNDRIRELVPADLIDADTRLVLTNALWLRGAWLHPFGDGATAPAPFARAGGAAIDVPTMHVVEQFAYAEDDRLQVVRLPFAGGQFVCDVVLPREGVALRDAETAMLAGAYLPELASERVQVALPRFTIAAKLRLRETLEALGVQTAFDAGRADFSGIRVERDLCIGEVVHQTWIAVDEKGAEAAAATAVVMKRGSAARPGEPKVFRADRPFAFVIRHRDGLVLFQGRVTDPSAPPQ